MSPQEHARARLAKRARAVARIRRGVLVAVLAAFVLAWGVIAATGSMGTATAATQAATTGSTATTTGSTGDADSSSSGDDSAASGGVTTAQS